MYTTKNFKQMMPLGLDGFIEDLLQNGKVLTNELWNEDRMHVPVNIKETEKSYILKVIAPGVKKEDIKLKLDKNILSISYEHVKEEDAESVKTLRNEYSFKSFKRSFTLSDKISNNISAKYNEGILEITLVKKEVEETASQEINID